MANAKIDENREGSTLVVEETNEVTNSLLVDPVTGRLLIAIYSVEEPADPVKNVIKIDANRENVAFGVTDDANATEVPLAIDNRSGYLFVDILVE